MRLASVRWHGCAFDAPLCLKRTLIQRPLPRTFLYHSTLLGCSFAIHSSISSTAASSFGSYENERFDTSLPPPPKSSTISTVMPYLLKVGFSQRNYHLRVVFAVFLVIVSKSTGLLAPYFLKLAVEKLSGGTAFVKLCILNLLLFGCCKTISGFAHEITFPVFAPVAQASSRKITAAVFNRMLFMDMEYHLNQKAGTLSPIIDRGARGIQFMFRTLIFRILPTFFELVAVTFIFSNLFTPFVSLALVLAAALYIGFTITWVESSVNARRQMIEFENRQSGKAVDVLQNFETVTLFNNQSFEAEQFHELLLKYQEFNLRYETRIALLNSGQNFIVTVGLTLCLVITLIASPSSKAVTSGDLVLMQGMIAQLWTPLAFFGWFYRETQQSLLDMQGYLKILNTESAIKDGHLNFQKVTKPSFPNGNGNGAKHYNDGVHIEFQNVTFGYSSARTVLKNITFDIPAGTSVAFVGHSGSGKSTIVNLLVRLYDINSGCITFDGYDCRDLTVASLRSVIGPIPQDTVLFNDTIYANILYGNPSASYEQVTEAAKLAQLDDAIRQFPEGYETIVGERGLKLSGGEKQRVAIARIFLRDPKLLICDEATSALDTATEQEIMSSLTDLAKGRTSVFVAHRLSTIQKCDKIIVLSEGQIIEQGTHEDLMALEGTYATMWRSQARRSAQGNATKSSLLNHDNI